MNTDLDGFRQLEEHLKDPTPGVEELRDAHGRRWRAHRYPRPGIRLILEPMDGAGTGFTTYEAASTRPDGYPDDLPFIPNAVAMVGTMPTTPPGRMVTWSEMADAAAFATEVEAVGVADGWTTTRSLAAGLPGPATMGEARRGTWRRHLSVVVGGAESAVILMQSGAPDPS